MYMSHDEHAVAGNGGQKEDKKLLQHSELHHQGEFGS